MFCFWIYCLAVWLCWVYDFITTCYILYVFAYMAQVMDENDPQKSLPTWLTKILKNKEHNCIPAVISLNIIWIQTYILLSILTVFKYSTIINLVKMFSSSLMNVIDTQCNYSRYKVLFKIMFCRSYCCLDHIVTLWCSSEYLLSEVRIQVTWHDQVGFKGVSLTTKAV